jgi:hypothetical protein
MGWPFWAKRKLRGVRLVATDSDWSAGDGPDVRGSTDALLLLMTGRTVVLPRLAGAGTDILDRRFAPDPTDRADRTPTTA